MNDEEIPESFLEAIEDLKAGRLYDLDDLLDDKVKPQYIGKIEMTYTFTPKELEQLHSNFYELVENRKGPEGYEGWYICSDTDTGEFDSEKGSMYDYEISLFDEKEEYMGEAIGGYYNGPCGECFNHTLTFTPPTPPTEADMLNNFLKRVICTDLYDAKISALKEYLSNIGN